MNKIILLAIVFSGLMGVGILGNSFFIDIQPLGSFASLDELPGSMCSCADSDGNFSPLNCEQFEGVYADSPEAVCQSLALNGMASYGEPPLQTQGCNADFWKMDQTGLENSVVWPEGYSPNYYFNEIFQVTVSIPVQDGDEESVETGIETGEIIVGSLGNNTDSGIESVEETPLDSLGNNTDSDTETIEDEVSESLVVNSELSNPDMGINLAGALQLQGTPLNDLLRESVSAMLNAAHSEINYPYTVAEIITMTQIALANEEYDETIINLKQANDRGNTPICNA